ncbi:MULTISPECIES: hypothetical protein [unclassified Microbacterium]|jgi:hypothetical protein|uniref:hypothetical protein n=1 Tax=unclassified Microbacterium TaxID=2609290 RepID=UPI0006F2FA42|nr:MULTISPECIES: hypothetical protein [unclassified Microbacterium]AOX45347.1 hypothetical protein BJP65_05630 [Microbacterium sp. BH-3-3-3]KQT74108.1 hypothetical protein ASG45_05775 [Microbacterium sp. Leaf436]
MELGALAVGIAIGVAVAGAGLGIGRRAQRRRDDDDIRAAAETAWMRAAFGEGRSSGDRDDLP